MRWLREWLGSIRTGAPRPLPSRPPMPAGWTKTLDDLMAEKRTVSGDEIEWARDYERSQLRTWARFPRDREVFEAERDLEMSYITHWAAPFSGGGKHTMRKGTRIRVAVPAFDQQPVGVYAEPLDAALEKEIVPEDERSASKYGGFSLFVKTAQLNKDFRLV